MINQSNTPFTVISTITVYTLTATSAMASADADYSFAVVSDWQDCQQLNTEYQTVYAFETASFYVNICQKNNSYFYLGEAKQNEQSEGIFSPRSSIFIPAYSLENGTSFRADNGNVSYLVVLPLVKPDRLNPNISKPSEAILTIKRNDKLVSIESSLNKYCHQSETTLVWDTIELQPHNSNQLATIPQQQDIGLEFSVIAQSDRLLPTETFNSDSRFDFYRLGGELHRLTTCN